MTFQEFWRLIALIGGYPVADEREPFSALEEELAGREVEEITSFEDLLASALFRLDRRTYADLPTIDTDRSQSSDSFLYNRCAVVVAGEVAFESVLAGSRPFQGYTHSYLPSSERILYVAQKAYERKTGTPWEYVSAVDYETGSNESEW
ncbi:DUF4240 domain-containing protein [Salinispora sp. H7-4]|uniref:DUF4240 domain-containing protein n=1 Tax=Salinispora sp. H7-4 TaxID=2748321 RepID=UPI0015D2E63E|nr:DUF4240 domain-containing protein [Salinispora sp. H7-4]NYT95575.1 DUF4240 domain-containing protein [Salinispora sp. H7-4]